jgi:hypothetical protein
MRLRKIELLLPVKTSRESIFLDEFIAFLSILPTASKRKRSVTFFPEFPYRSWPSTTIGPSSSTDLQLRFLHNKAAEIEITDAAVRRVLGMIELPARSETAGHTLEISRLYEIFHNKLVSFDHIGLNIPSSLVSRSEYQNFVNSLGSSCTLHHYPTGEDWDFILPSTRSEWIAGISEFKSGREPRWEFVYDDYTTVPVIQLCVETKLTKKRLVQFLPDPVGISYEGLPFRTVFVSIPWNNLRIRFDFQAYSRNRQNSWITGEWLATRGKRLGK